MTSSLHADRRVSPLSFSPAATPPLPALGAQMRWTPTPNSSNVSAFAYDEPSRTLHVRFVSGHSYAYQNVPPEHEDGLANADSVGRYLHENIKGQYEHKRG